MVVLATRMVTTLVAVRPLRLTAVRLPRVYRLEGPVFLYGDCEGLFQHNQAPALRLDTVDTSAVTSMRSMFRNSSFNGDLHSWDTAYVTDMSRMFEGASRFNQALPAWDTGRASSTCHTCFLVRAVLTKCCRCGTRDTSPTCPLCLLMPPVLTRFCRCGTRRTLPTCPTCLRVQDFSINFYRRGTRGVSPTCPLCF
jgi:hypothetical protein